MGLGLGKGLTADYANNADGEKIEENDQIVNGKSTSGASSIEY